LKRLIDTMEHATARLHQAHEGFWNGWLAAFFAQRSRPARRARLDVGSLSDHLKRDMGFLDGKDPSGKRR